MGAKRNDVGGGRAPAREHPLNRIADLRCIGLSGKKKLDATEELMIEDVVGFKPITDLGLQHVDSEVAT